MSQDDALLPPLSPPSLFPPDVRGYAIEKRNEGWDVRKDGDRFVIQINEMLQVILSPDESGVCRVATVYATGITSTQGRASNMRQLEAMVEPMLGQHPITSVELKRGEPATDREKISILFGSAKLEAVHDPFLDNKGLATLLSILKLANGAVPNLRLMTGVKGVKGLTLDFVTSFLSELDCSAGQVRISSDPEAHRRFYLLTGGTSVRQGPSLNKVDKNEVADTHSDRDDREFFNQHWKSGKPYK